jgi:RNA polymerase sigma factor (sigma-70 family)
LGENIAMSRTLDELAQRAQNGERDALEGLLRGLQDPLYRLSLRFLGHPEAARDATQEVLILVITQLSSFRAESTVTTWAYRVASRHLLRQRKRDKRSRFALLAAQLAQPANTIEPALRETAEDRLLEEELFLGCTQAMLRALDPAQRIAFVLGAVLELESAEAAAVLEISEPTFRKRLSRARSALDAFVSKNCGVANSAAPCRCAFQVNHAHRQGRLDPAHLRYAVPTTHTSLEALRAVGEIARVKRSLELYRAQPTFRCSEDFSARVREMLESARTLSLS